MNATSLKSTINTRFDVTEASSVKRLNAIGKNGSQTLAKTRIQPVARAAVRPQLSREEALRQAILRTG